MTNKPTLIAIDGPAASGKGTLAKRLAAHYGFCYLDTGKLYRALAYKMKQEGLTTEDIDRAVLLAQNLQRDDLAGQHLYDEKIGSFASKISAHPDVRASLMAFQKNFAQNPAGAVLDGRDIGTVICPHADYKFFVNASLDKRTTRRVRQLKEKGHKVDYVTIKNELEQRDKLDAERALAPLTPATDAHMIDTTEMNADQVFAMVTQIIDH